MAENKVLPGELPANDVYSQIEAGSGKLPVTEQDGDFEANIRSVNREGLHILKERARESRETIFLGIAFALLACLVVYALYTGVKNYLKSDFTINILPWWLTVSLLVLPLTLWFFSTGVQFFAYYNRKRGIFLTSMFISLAALSTLYLSFLSRPVQVFMLFLPIGKSMNEKTVVLSSASVTFIMYFIPMFICTGALVRTNSDRIFVDWINGFTSSDYRKRFDRESRYRYSQSVIRNMKTGKRFEISETDRYMHELIMGSTGTGKTSTVVSVTFEEDMRKKAINVDEQKKAMHELMAKGKVIPTRPFKDEDFCIDYFKVSPGIERKEAEQLESVISRLKFERPNAGVTVFAPNTEYCDELYDICLSKGIKANRIDPVKTKDKQWKPGFIGFNPLYVYYDDGLDREDYFRAVFDAAKSAADVNQAVFEIEGTQDAYFSGLNRSIYVTAAVICIIGAPLIRRGWYATPGDVQDVLNDFEKIKPYRSAIIQKYGVRNEAGNIITEIGKAKVVKNLQFVIDCVDKDMLGHNATKMTEQAVGLRNIVNETLLLVRDILCNDRTLDFNEAFSEGQVTLINFNMAMGEKPATNFGLFILLNFITAALRRPGTAKTRIPHFLVCDECARLTHPVFELALSLLRQYRISVTCCFQNLSQFNKNRSTAYLKEVFESNCANQIFYGRCGAEEIRYIEDIVKKRRTESRSVSVRDTSLADDNTAKGFTSQFKEEMEACLDGSEARYRRFLECTVVPVKDSCSLEPFIGRANFLPKYKLRAMRRVHYADWSSYYVDNRTNDEPILFNELSSVKVTDTTKPSGAAPRIKLDTAAFTSVKTAPGRVWISAGDDTGTARTDTAAHVPEEREDAHKGIPVTPEPATTSEPKPAFRADSTAVDESVSLDDILGGEG